MDKDKIDKVLDKYFEVRNWDTETSLLGEKIMGIEFRETSME